MTKVKMMQELKKAHEKCAALEETVRYKDEVINNYKKSLETLKEEPGRSVQAELLELRKRTKADGFIIDELRKGMDENGKLISILEKQIDSLTLLVGVIVNNIRNGGQKITKEGHLKIHQDELKNVYSKFDVVVREADSGFVFIGCKPKDCPDEAPEADNAPETE